MKIETSNLKQAMNVLKPAFTKAGVEGFNEYVFFDKEYIFAYNEGIKIAYPFKCGFAAGLPSSEFSKFLSKVKTKEIEFEKTEDGIHIKAGRVKAHFIDNVDIMERMKDMPSCPEDFDRLPMDFLRGLELCLISASNDLRSLSSMIYVNEREISSTDAFRMSKYTMEKGIENSFLISSKHVKELIKFVPAFYVMEESYIHFITEENVVISILMGMGEINDVNLFINNNAGERILLPDNIDEMIDVTSIMTSPVNEIDKKVDIIISDGKIKCEAQNNMGNIETENEIEIEGSFKFAVNPLYFSVVLSHVKEMLLRQDIESDENWIIFYSDNFRYMFSLMGV